MLRCLRLRFLLVCIAATSCQAHLLDDRILIEVFDGNACIEGFLMSVPVTTRSLTVSANVDYLGGFTNGGKMLSLENVEIKQSSLKPKTPMCMINELARYNNIDYKYTLVAESGPSHQKTFTVTLNLGIEAHSGSGSSIKKAQHGAAANALHNTKYQHPPPKFVSIKQPTDTPTVQLNALAMKLRLQPNYETVRSPTFAVNGSGPAVFSQYNPLEPVSHHSFTQCVIDSSETKKEHLYEVCLKLKDRSYNAFGPSLQEAKHNAAEKALEDFNLNPLNGEAACDSAVLQDDGVFCSKSPISELYEKALKLKMAVTFRDIGSYGAPHVRMHETECILDNEYRVVGSGPSKKLAKQNAAELMLQTMHNMSLSTAASAAAVADEQEMKQRDNAEKKKRRKTKIARSVPMNNDDENNNDNGSKEPIEEDAVSKLYHLCRRFFLPVPMYSIVEKKMGEFGPYMFVATVTVDDRVVTSTGRNKKGTKQEAANKMLQDLGLESAIKQRTGDVPNESGDGVYGLEQDVPENGRMIAPGLFLMKSGNETYPGTVGIDRSGNSEVDYGGRKSTWGEQAGNEQGDPFQMWTSIIDAEDHLKRVSDKLGITTQFLNMGHREQLAENVVVLQIATSTPQMCIGKAESLNGAKNKAATEALKFLSRMGYIKMEKINDKRNIRKEIDDGMVHVKISTMSFTPL